MTTSVINSDDGLVSGTSGLKTTGGDDGNLNIQSNGTTVAAVTDGAFSISGNNISAVNSLGFRNRVINGDMRIDQRNNGASVTPTNGLYTLDRWRSTLTQASKYTVQQNAGAVTPPAGFTNYLGVTSSSAYSVVTGDIFSVTQYVEGFNVSDLGFGTANAQTVTLSFWVQSSLTGTFGGALQNSGSTRSYPFTYSISAANTWEQKTVSIAGDTSGTWLTTNGLGLAVQFGLGGGATFSGTAGAWAGADYRTATGATSVVGTNGATFYITGVQLEAGSVATPFERRDYGRELIMCQRYYEAGAYIFRGMAIAGGARVQAQIQHVVTKRSAPTTTITNLGENNPSITGGIIVGSTAVTGWHTTSTNFTTASTGDNMFGFNWNSSAEL